MSRAMRKLDFCLCENKGADQLHSYCEADQRLCFRYTDSTIHLLLKYKISRYTDRSVSDLVGNPEDWFSRIRAQISSVNRLITTSGRHTLLLSTADKNVHQILVIYFYGGLLRNYGYVADHPNIQPA